MHPIVANAIKQKRPVLATLPAQMLSSSSFEIEREIELPPRLFKVLCLFGAAAASEAELAPLGGAADGSLALDHRTLLDDFVEAASDIAGGREPRRNPQMDNTHSPSCFCFVARYARQALASRRRGG